MIDSKHYVPVLRWKAAEKKALEKLTIETKKTITPLVEFVMPKPYLFKGKTTKERNEKKIEKTSKEMLDESIIMFESALPKIPEEMKKCWGDSPIFIDMRFVDASIRANCLTVLLEYGAKQNLFFVPVVNMIPVVVLESDRQTQTVAISRAKKYGGGLGLRVTRTSLRRHNFGEELIAFLTKSGLTETQVDLLIDVETADDEYASLVERLDQIPNLKSWRSFVIISGAFPPDLTELDVGSHNIQRADWLNWNNKSYFKKLSRTPAFGDYTIQCPVYKEPPRISYPSASIRYAASDNWLVMRGQGGPDKEFKQYLANARLLTEQSEFDGQNFSYGDAYIAEKAKDLGSSKTGSPTTWLVAGINRHLTKTVTQIANLGG